MKEIHITNGESRQKYVIGRMGDDLATKVYFDYLTGTNNFLKLQLNGVDLPPIPIPNNEWLVDDTYTCLKKADTYVAQTVYRDGINYIANSNLFLFAVGQSIGSKESERTVPVHFQTAYEEMVYTTETLQQAKANGEFDGLTNYEIAVKNGYQGTEAEWLATLKGEKGDKGDIGLTGPQGETGPAGPKGDTGLQGPTGETGPQGPQGTPGEATPEFVEMVNQSKTNADNTKAEADRAKQSADNALLNSELALKLAIKPTAQGNPIALDDSADYGLLGIKVKGIGFVNEISNVGRNLFDGKIESGGIDLNTGELTNQLARKRSSDFIPVEPSTTYTATRGNLINYRWIIGYDESKKGISDSGRPQKATLSDFRSSSYVSTFTTSPTTHYIKWVNTTDSGLDEKFQIELGSVAMPYEPYKGQTITLSQPIELAGNESVEKVDGVYSKVTPTGATPLPLVDQQALESLQTFYPNTTLITDSGITLEVQYLADTQSYIDKKAEQNKNAILSMGGNI